MQKLLKMSSNVDGVDDGKSKSEFLNELIKLTVELRLLS